MEDRKLVFGGRVVVSRPAEVDVAALRERLGMTQNLFAARFGFPLATLRHWEYGQRKPTGASLTLLNVIKRNPRAVLGALRRSPRDLRPIEDYTALWDAGEQRDAAAEAQGLEETSAMDRCPLCDQPRGHDAACAAVPLGNALHFEFLATQVVGSGQGTMSTLPLARRSATSRRASTPRSSG